MRRWRCFRRASDAVAALRGAEVDDAALPRHPACGDRVDVAPADGGEIRIVGSGLRCAVQFDRQGGAFSGRGDRAVARKDALDQGRPGAGQADHEDRVGGAGRPGREASQSRVWTRMI
jgi:hypothetical protein